MRPSAHQLANACHLCLRKQVRLDLPDPEVAGDRLGHTPVVAGQQDGADAALVQAVDGRARLGANGVGDDDRAEQPPVARDETSLAAPSAGTARPADVIPLSLQPRLVADQDA